MFFSKILALPFENMIFNFLIFIIAHYGCKLKKERTLQKLVNIQILHHSGIIGLFVFSFSATVGICSFQQLDWMDFHENWFTHKCSLQDELLSLCGELFSLTSPVAPTSGHYFFFFKTLLYDQNPAKLTTFPSTSTLLCVKF